MEGYKQRNVQDNGLEGCTGAVARIDTHISCSRWIADRMKLLAPQGWMILKPKSLEKSKPQVIDEVRMFPRRNLSIQQEKVRSDQYELIDERSCVSSLALSIRRTGIVLLKWLRTI